MSALTTVWMQLAEQLIVLWQNTIDFLPPLY